MEYVFWGKKYVFRKKISQTENVIFPYTIKFKMTFNFHLVHNFFRNVNICHHVSKHIRLISKHTRIGSFLLTTMSCMAKHVIKAWESRIHDLT